MLACVAATSAAALHARAPESPRVRVLSVSPALPFASVAVPEHGMPHPDVHRAATFDPVARNAACVGCHVDIAAEWDASLHHASATEPIYLRGFASEPFPFCRECHAPEAPDEGDLATRTALGVGCVTCHVVSGEPPLAPTTSGSAPHAVTVEAKLGTAAACAGCHEFHFDGTSAVPNALMQSTVSEHAASAKHAESCASCHMPMIVANGRRHRSHRFAVTEASLKRAVRVLPCRPSRERVRITLTPGEVGHAFPTGDIFRRLALRVGYGDASAVQYLERRVFPRAFDTRVGEGGVVVELETGGIPEGAQVTWSLDYQVAERSNGDALTVASRVVIASGTLKVGECR